MKNQVVIERIKATSNPEAFQVQVSTTEIVEPFGDNNVFGFLGLQERKRLAWPNFHADRLKAFGIDVSKQYTDDKGNTLVSYAGGVEINSLLESMDRKERVKIVVMETTKPIIFTRQDGSVGVRSPKIQPNTGAVLCVDGLPIYRSTELVVDKGQDQDVLVKHNSTMSLADYEEYRKQFTTSNEAVVNVA